MRRFNCEIMPLIDMVLPIIIRFILNNYHFGNATIREMTIKNTVSSLYYTHRFGGENYKIIPYLRYFTII